MNIQPLGMKLRNASMDLKSFQIPKPTSILPLSGGANNRVFQLTFLDQEPLIYKEYFQHPNDLRERLLTEFSFLEYSWSLGIRNIPQPLQANRSLNAALYSFIKGRPIQSEDLTPSMIEKLLSFFLKLNQQKTKGLHLPDASESCFSTLDFVQITESRIHRLKKIDLDSRLQKEMNDFLIRELYPKWLQLKESVCKTALHRALAQEERCLSPSDFGFHNALLTEEKELSFLDFEYAGWDDPCKTVCDLFCQPRIPIPKEYFSQVGEIIASVASNPEACLKRIETLWPVMQMKWCCILLNSFTPIGLSRRTFSLAERREKQQEQLIKAKTLFYQIETKQ